VMYDSTNLVSLGLLQYFVAEKSNSKTNASVLLCLEKVDPVWSLKLSSDCYLIG